MLKIQRASAGSGKTYALAKTFILNLIAFKNSKDEWKIRNDRQIEDALHHILAITFTNKATNEMKSRIVKNLSLLSQAKNLLPSQPVNFSDYPYLKDIADTTGARFQDIGIAADTALKTLLNNYSLFKISTIDSFFQEILRTFVYEADISDSYQLEIDSSFVNDSALSDAITELDLHPADMGNAKFWLKIIIREEAKKSQKWNPFNKKSASKSLYSKLRDALMKLESEDFKNIKAILDTYFSIPGTIKNLPQVYMDFKQAMENERKNLLQNILTHHKNVVNLISANHYPASHFKSRFFDHLDKISKLKIDGKLDFKTQKVTEFGSVFLKDYRINHNPLDKEAMEMYDYVKEWQEPSKTSFYKNWEIYGELLPYLGLILEVKTFLAEVLNTNNLVQLGDTSYILKRIIGKDDAPFVYERLGNRIDNYLIDEFQDTSRMQWEIIYPLLAESEAKDNDSLIIGDPKQSIYRFRNANHTLITEVVPNAFPGHQPAGFSKEENANWRSHTKIVEFNNFFFKNLAKQVFELSETKGLPTDFIDLYSNVVQEPVNKKGLGYVEWQLLNKKDFPESDSEDSEEEDNISDYWFENAVLEKIGPLVSSLLERGYRPKDIGILVNTNEKGKKVVEALMGYNSILESDKRKIEFISEESLLLSSSQAVGIIIGLIEKLINPGSFNPKEKEDKKANAGKKRKYFNWNNVKISYNVFAKNHAQLSPWERILKFIEEEEFEISFSEFIKSLPTPSLSSLVEAIIATFLDNSIKTRDAIYLASFQDAVSEYSVNHHADPASFLEWWYARGKKISVSSPDNLDAVQIMTIHKSKGLEFKCVIIPFGSDSFTPSSNKEEWRWIPSPNLGNIALPPILPVKTSSKLLGSDYEKIYKEYFDQILTDKTNMYYVAFTRARNELYIFSKKPEKKTWSLQDFLLMILDSEKKDTLSIKKEVSSEDPKKASITYSYGEPLSEEEIEAENREEARKQIKNQKFFKDYYINQDRPQLKTIAAIMSYPYDM